jgi:anti-sigma-K factor RskA
VYDRFAEQAAPYVLGALTGPEQLDFEAHLAVCSACASEVRGFAPVVEALAIATPEAAPESGVRRALVLRLRDQRGFQAAWLGLAASALLVVGLGAYAVQLRGRVTGLDARLDEAGTRAASSERQIAGLKRTAVEAQTTASVLAAPDLARVDLGGQPSAPAATARVFWSRSRGMVFTASDLPNLPAGRVYQLWVLTSQPAPISAGLLRPDSDGRVAAVFATSPDLPRPIAMAVTLEPEGGVLSPTGDKYLVGLAN